jgi:glc operon protein GlcG
MIVAFCSLISRTIFGRFAMRRIRGLCLMVLVGFSLTASLHQAAAQAPAAPPIVPYGAPIALETALKVLAAAKTEADANNWPVAIAVVDTGGHLVAFHRLDNTQIGSVTVAIEKAKTSALFRRPTKAFQDVLAQGGDGLRILKLPGATPLEGGLPIVVDGKIVGGIGVSGVQSSQDAQIAAAGLTALTK